MSSVLSDGLCLGGLSVLLIEQGMLNSDLLDNLKIYIYINLEHRTRFSSDVRNV